MARCLLCTSVISEDQQHYEMGNIGPEITSVIEQNLGHEITEHGKICAQCFANAMQNIGSSSQARGETGLPPVTSQCEIRLPPEINVCVWCRSLLFRRRSQMLGEGPERHLITERISPRMIPDGSRVCYACWVHARRQLEAQEIISVPPVDTNVCVWCQTSLAQRRRPSIPEGPERDEIIQRIYPREIPPGGLVCYACWVSARRNVQRVRNETENVEQLLEPGPLHSHFNETCARCRMSLFRRRIHLLTGPERDEVATRIYPSELPEHALVCTNCFGRAQENIQIQQGEIINVSTNDSMMTLDDFARTPNSSSHCFVPGCYNSER